MKALAEGIGTKIKHSLDVTLGLAPRHADAHTALGVYHAEVIDKTGRLVGALTYGASSDESMRHFETALELNPGSAITRVEYAKALMMLEGKKKEREARELLEQAAATAPRDAMEKLDVELARRELGHPTR